MAVTIDGIVAWLENWFYKKETINTYLNAKANKNLTNANMNVVTDSGGNITTEEKPTIPDVSGFIDTAGTGLSKSGTTLNHSNTISAQSTVGLKKIKFDSEGHITGVSAVTSSDLPSHQHPTQAINHDIALSNLNIGSNSTQSQINNAIDSAIGNLSSIRAIEVVSTLPTASSSTMGKLYIVSENSKVNVYYTEQSGSTYSWHKMDTDILDELSVAWSDITNKPSVFPPEGHNHDDSEIAITDEDLQTDWEVTNQYEFNAMAKTVTENLDSAKADIDHTHTKSDITDFSHAHGQISNDGKITYTPVTVASDDYIVITDTNDSSKVKRVANLLTDHIKDGTAHSNIGSSANATQSAINTAINSALGGKASSGHHHGQINNDGAITSTAVTVDSNDNIVITDYSDSSKVKRVANLLAGHIVDSSAHTNIGSSINDTQATINSDIDTALSNKADSVHTHNNYVTSIALVPKATDNTGAITLYYGDEPS